MINPKYLFCIHCYKLIGFKEEEIYYDRERTLPYPETQMIYECTKCGKIKQKILDGFWGQHLEQANKGKFKRDDSMNWQRI